MWRITKAMLDRTRRLLTAEADLTEDAFAGQNYIKIAQSETANFSLESLTKFNPYVAMKDSTQTGRRGTGDKKEVLAVKDVTIDTIYFETALQNDWLTSNSASVRRAPNGVMVNQVSLGRLNVVPKYSHVSLVPASKNIDWYTISGTRDTVQMDFMCYIKDNDTERGVESLIKLTDAVEWILMSNLHIQLDDAVYTFEVTSKASARNARYGEIEVGSELLKASTITWEAEIYFLRDFVTKQGLLETPWPPTGAERV